MVSCVSDGRVMRPVVSQVVHDVPRPIHNGMLNLPIRIVGRRNHLYVGRALRSWVEGCSVAGPLEQGGTQIIRHGRVRLQSQMCVRERERESKPSQSDNMHKPNDQGQAHTE